MPAPAAARLSVVGEDARLGPRAAQTLSLALHELTTNAAKHGALSVPKGRVEIHSAVERAGAAAHLDGDRRSRGQIARAQGFGTVIVERSIAHELGGSAELDFERGGLRCHIRIPLR